MGDQTAQPGNWTDILLTGVSAIVDSQLAKNYSVSDPRYQTAGGVAGQGQTTVALSGNSTLIWAGAIGLALLLIFALKR